MNRKMETKNVWRTALAIVACVMCGLCELAAGEVTFGAGSVTADGVTMPYREAEVCSNPDSAGALPALVVYLHGGSSKGSDNEKQMQEPGIDSIVNYLTARGTHAMVLVPQCPADKSWTGVMFAVVKSMIDHYVLPGKVDATRVYAFGGSMGGTGTWGMVSAYPNVFAAAMPVAGNPSKCIAENVSKTPIFTVMGTADAIMKVETAAQFVDALTQLGGVAVIETEEGWTHEMTCIQSYTTRRLDWVFGKKNNRGASVETIGAQSGIVESIRYYSLDGRVLVHPLPGMVCVKETYFSGGGRKVEKIFLRYSQ